MSELSFRLDIQNYVILFSAIVNLFLALFVYIKDRKKKSNVSYSLFTIGVVLWSIGMFMYRGIPDQMAAIWWAKFLYFSSGSIPAFLLYFSYVFPKEKLKLKMWQLIVIFAPSFFFIFCPFIPGFIVENIIIHRQIENEMIFGVGYNFWGFYLICYFILSFINLFRTFKKSSNIVKLQIRYILIGAITAAIGGAITNLILPAFGNTNFGWLGQSFTIIMVGCVSYAITRYRLMNLRFILTRSILYSVLVGVTAFLFTLITFLTGQFFEGQGQIVVTLIVSLIIVIGLDPLKKLLARLTDKFFYRGKIDYQKVLRNISEIIARELDLGKLLKSIEYNLEEKLKVKSIQTFHKSGANHDQKFISISHKDAGEITGDSIIIKYLGDHKKLIVTEELARQKADVKSDLEKQELQKLEEALDEKKCSLAVPIIAEHRLTALFLIGPKLSGGTFTQEDLDFFSVLSPQVATALDKSKLYEEVQEFNISLQDKVRQATAELEERNRYLVALQKLSRVITRSLDYSKVMQTIADGIATQLSFVGGILSFINFKDRTISVSAISSTPKIEAILKMVPQDPTTYAISLDDPDNLGVKAILTKEVQIHDKFWDFLRPAIHQKLGQALQLALGVKSIVAVPVYSEEKVIGVIDFVLNKDASQITNTEKEMMHALADQAGIVSRNLQYYEQIQKANDELSLANIRLQKLDKAKSEFLSIASHQLRTPLTSIKGYLSMIVEGDYGEVPQKIGKVLGDVFLSSDRLTRLVNTFLNVSRIESGRDEVTLKDVDIVKLAEEAIEELKPSADRSGLPLYFHKPDNILPHIKLDKDKIKDVLINLIDNSIKYTPEGKVEIIITQEVDKVKVSIKDTGVGILKSEVNELFRKFVRGVGIAQIDTNGSGLGLYISKKFVEAHGGEIWAESEGKGKGATFSFILPLSGK